jgi:hypothetical protein
VVYQLKLPTHWKIHNVFHSSLLTPYCKTPEYGENFTQPPPELIKGEEEYIVDQIMNSRRHGKTKKLPFLICWEGYSLAHDSWEDAVDVHAPEKLEEYYQRKQTTIQALEYKGGQHCPEKSPSTPIPLPSLNNTGLPLQISTATFMQYDGQTYSNPTSDVPAGATGTGGWNYPDDIDTWLYTGAAFTLDQVLDDHEWSQVFMEVLDATMWQPPVDTTLRLVDTWADAHVASFDPFRDNDIPDLYPPLEETPSSRNSGRSTRGSLKSLTSNFASTSPFSSTPWPTNHRTNAGPGESGKLPWTIYVPAPTSGSLAHQQQWLCEELWNSLCSPRLGTMDEGGATGSAAGPGTPLKRLSLDEMAMHTVPKKKRKTPSRSWAIMKLTRYYCSKC